MTQKTIYLTIGALILGAVLLGAGVVLAGTHGTNAPAIQEPKDSTDRTITVGATGTAEAPPDKAIVRVAVEARSTDPGTARSHVAENVTRIRDQLIAIGIDESNIRTEDFRISEDHHRRPPRKTTDDPQYVARHRLVVEVTDVNQVGTVIDTAVDSGSAQIHDVQFTLADETRTELRNAALEDAMAQAREQATTIALTESLSITSVHTVSTQDIHIPRRHIRFAAGDGAEGGASTDLNSGPVEVTATVTVTYNMTG